MLPVIDATFGNLISGSFKAHTTNTNPPTYAVSGQNYDIFAINSLKLVVGTTLTEQYVYQVQKSNLLWIMVQVVQLLT